MISGQLLSLSNSTYGDTRGNVTVIVTATGGTATATGGTSTATNGNNGRSLKNNFEEIFERMMKLLHYILSILSRFNL